MKLEDDAYWRDASKIADYIYGILDDMPEDDKWTIVAKLRNAIFDLTSSVAEAAGAPDPRDKTHSYGGARRAIFSIKNALIMADKSGSLELNSSIVVKLDDLADRAEKQIAANDNAIVEFLKKYEPKEEKA